MSIPGNHIKRVDNLGVVADTRAEKMIANGPRRIKMGVKSWRFA